MQGDMHACASMYVKTYVWIQVNAIIYFTAIIYLIANVGPHTLGRLNS